MKLALIDSRARASRSHLALGWSQAHWIAFGSSQLGGGVLHEDFDFSSLLVFRSCIKIDSFDMIKFTHTHTSSICLVFV